MHCTCVWTPPCFLLFFLFELSSMLAPSVRGLERFVWFLWSCLASICILYNIVCLCVFVVSPVIALSPAEVSVIEEQQVTLPCVLLAGNPLPVRHWLHENTLVRLNRGSTFFRDQRALCCFLCTDRFAYVACFVLIDLRCLVCSCVTGDLRPIREYPA